MKKLPIKLELPDGFLDEEVRLDYTISSDMKEVWAVELDLLNEFQRVCAKYDIRYFADGGTMLGAIRHGGYIPWDDDIDVMMMRDQYDKLCEIANKEFRDPYFFQTEYTDPSSLRGHAQLRNSYTTAILEYELEGIHSINQGIFIDIFPIDAVPDDEVLLKKKVKKVDYYLYISKKIASFSDAYRPAARNKKIKRLGKWIIHCLAVTVIRPLFNYSYYYSKYEKESRTYNDDNTQRVAKFFCIPFSKNQIWYRDDFDDVIDVKFEMLSIPVPIGYKRIMDIFFGPNWMVPKKIDTTHGGVIFDAKKSYLEYLEVKK